MIKKTLCFSNPAYLSLRNRQLVIRLPEVETCSRVDEAFKQVSQHTIPIEDIGVVVIEHQRITISSGLLEALLENNCAVITCDGRSLPVGLLLPLCGNTTQSERFRHQLDASVPLRKQLWQQTVRQKILNQASVLLRYTCQETRCMNTWAAGVKSGDTQNMEARAAAYYWKHLFTNIPNFVRDREGAPPNHLLNYGYAVLRAVMARSLVISGLLPTLGIHHHNRYNAYCLADDMMEPYRPYVDELVLDIISKVDDYTPLTKEIKMMLLTIPTIDVTIEGKRSPLMVAALQTTASLYKCYTGELRRVALPEI